MIFYAALTIKTEWTEAVDDLARQLRAQGAHAAADLALVFVHPQFVPQIGDLAGAIKNTTGARHLLGSTGGGIIGVDREIEQQPAASVLVAQLPDVEITPFRITEHDVEESTGPGFWHFQLEIDPAKNPKFVLLADPMSLEALRLVHGLGEAYPGAPIVGGLASGGQQAGENRLLLDDEVFDDGAVGIALSGRVDLHTIVSQGCRPVGQPLVVTRAEKNIVLELGGQPPMQVLQQMLPKLTPRDQKLARTALFLGRVINEYQEEFGRGDFLIRNLIGHDPNSGAVAVGDWMRTGQTVQFQVRDAETADEDLSHLLAQEKRRFVKGPPAGALLFSCLGRGEGMYGKPHHDIHALHSHLGPVPTAGFFCNGEIGPIGNKTFVHGFTSVIGLFREPAKITKEG